MKLLDLLKKIFSPTEKNENNLKPEGLYGIQNAFLDTLCKYTSITSTIESIDDDLNKKLYGSFCDKFECSLFNVTRGCYAIRFKDDMLPEEFHQVFNLLKNDMGDPNIFSEYDGYVWTREGYIITLGLVGLSYKYDVPMICVRPNTTKFSSTIEYKEYAMIADAINKPLIVRGINVQERGFYQIAYSRQFAYSTYIELPKSIIYVHYKERKLELSIVPVMKEGAYKVVKTKNQLRKYVFVRDISMVEEKLNELLEETKDYYEVN